jgi:hypothetical protein
MSSSSAGPHVATQRGILSDFSSAALGQGAPGWKSVLAYSDANFGEAGKVYRACGFRRRPSSHGAIRLECGSAAADCYPIALYGASTGHSGSARCGC